MRHAALLTPSLAAALALAAGAARAQDLAPCADRTLGPRAECGRLAVWEDRDARVGRRIEIAFVVLRAERPTGREPVFLFAGGPGQRGADLRGLATGPFASVRAVRDLVLVDQRGTGGSNALPCAPDLERDPAAAFGHVFDPALLPRCLAAYRARADLRFYTTEMAVRDVDELRARLGYERVLLWGGSYGTRLAQAYMRAYPSRVVAAVLDGVVPFDFRAPLTYAASAQQALARVLAGCRADAACRAAAPDAERALARLIARLAEGPLPATVATPAAGTVRVRMSLGDFGYAVRGILYDAAAARALPAMLRRADAAGDLSEFAQRYWQRAAAMARSGFAHGLHLAVFCAEDTPFVGEHEIAPATRGTFLGRYLLEEYRAACAGWVRAPLPPRAREPLRSDTPTLLLSGWLDPVTPPEAAERVARGLRNVRHVVVRNEAHGAGLGCALPATLHVLREGRLEGMPEVCDGVTSLYAAEARRPRRAASRPRTVTTRPPAPQPPSGS